MTMETKTAFGNGPIVIFRRQIEIVAFHLEDLARGVPLLQPMVAFASGAFRRNNERDRRWRYQCGRVNGLRARNPSVYAAWTDWANDWDKERSGTWGVMRIYQALENAQFKTLRIAVSKLSSSACFLS